MKFLPHATLAVLLAALLVGQRFGFGWAGGDGYVPELGAYDASGTHYGRGETVSTGADERAYLRVGVPGDIAALAELWLDYNTDVTLEQTNGNGVTVRLTRGRILAISHDAEHALTVQTNATRSAVFGGRLSVVNYDFRETVSVIPLDTSAVVLVKGSEAFATEKPVDIHETPPVSMTEFTFDPASGSAAEFYAWATE